MIHRRGDEPIYRSTSTSIAEGWLIQTHEGPVIGHREPDGTYFFLLTTDDEIERNARDPGNTWRPVTRADEPEATRVWSKFATWWVAEGKEWPAYDRG